MNFNELIHRERGRQLARVPKGGKRILSAGCAGSWYFEWFERQYGRVDEHIGLELHSPRPGDLPAYVRWVGASVDDMSAIEPSSVDLVFSGQNIEHLTPDVLRGFLAEAHRVLHDGGLLVVDSPNRDVTQAGGYLQPEHTLELTAAEIEDLLQHAGFVVERCEGIWSCRDPKAKHRRLPITTLPDAAAEIERRCDEARGDPEAAFIWWVVARKVGAYQAGAVAAAVQAIVLRQFASFVGARHQSQVGELARADGTEVVLRVAAATPGYALFGPYVPLRPGLYLAMFRYRWLPATTSSQRLIFDVVSAFGANSHGGLTIVRDSAIDTTWHHATISFRLEHFTTGIEARAFAQADALLRFGTEIIADD